ncbi:hypothetical protein LIER_04874 [Lithospermum erythrorhizon]|uniref:Uncharacterized protein n=1 Tax=Lithospermum erythrorhizon TaxID=34254 RepID=A0AAV3P140_LITER
MTAAYQAQKIEDLTATLSKEREGAKTWDAEKAILIFERDTLETHCKELEEAKVADDLRATEALNKDKKERDATLASVASIHTLATQKIREFLNNSKYEAKIRSECATYFATLALEGNDDAESEEEGKGGEDSSSTP